jgi:hypothetical protein
MGVSISLNQEPSEVNCHRVDSMVPHVRVLRQSTKSHIQKKTIFLESSLQNWKAKSLEKPKESTIRAM